MVEKILFGTVDETPIYQYVLKNSAGTIATVMNYGAILVGLKVMDAKGTLRDVVLGYDSLEEYFVNEPCHGAVVGRSANRIGNAEFSINGKTYHLAKNDGPNNLHSGPELYFHRVWNVEGCEENSVTFSLFSPDGDQGFAGNIKIYVSYELTEENELRICYQGTPDQDTVMNLTNHSYFNLDGHNAGSVLDHEVQILGDYITKTDAGLIPDGTLLPVKGTPVDFNEFKKIGKEIESDYEPIQFGHGYDQNWVIRDYDGSLRLAAQLRGSKSGLTMQVYTDLPGIQMYTSNFLGEGYGKEGALYHSRDGVALETQFFPNAVNVPEFVSPIVKAGEEFKSVTSFKFV